MPLVHFKQKPPILNSVDTIEYLPECNMRRIKIYLSSPAMIVSFILLPVCILLASRGCSEAPTWFRVLSPTGLKEAQAKTINIQQNANVTSITYAYDAETTSGAIITYTNTLNISDVSLNIDNMAQEFQSTIPIEYLPDAPAYSIISKKRWPGIYREQLAYSVAFKFIESLFLPTIFTLISLFCLIFLLWKGKKLYSIKYKTSENEP